MALSACKVMSKGWILPAFLGAVNPGTQTNTQTPYIQASIAPMSSLA